MISIIIILAGFGFFIHGILVAFRIVKTVEDDTVASYYVASKFIFGGIGAVVLGLSLYLSQ